jgi:hypothetical protein
MQAHRAGSVPVGSEPYVPVINRHRPMGVSNYGVSGESTLILGLAPAG